MTQLRNAPSAFQAGDAALVRRGENPAVVQLGDAATRSTGVAAGQVPLLDAEGKLDPSVLPEGSGGGSPDTPAQVRDKLESLTGGDRLNASAIRGLPDGVVDVAALMGPVLHDPKMARGGYPVGHVPKRWPAVYAEIWNTSLVANAATATTNGTIFRYKSNPTDFLQGPDGRYYLVCNIRRFDSGNTPNQFYAPHLLVSDNGLTGWQFLTSNPLINRTPFGWMGSRLSHCKLFHDWPNDQWIVYFTGGEHATDTAPLGAGIRATGAAVSRDGWQTWDIQPLPVATRGDHPYRDPADLRFYHSNIIFEDGFYWMFVSNPAAALRSTSPFGPFVSGPWNIEGQMRTPVARIGGLWWAVGGAEGDDSRFQHVYYAEHYLGPWTRHTELNFGLLRPTFEVEGFAYGVLHGQLVGFTGDRLSRGNPQHAKIYQYWQGLDMRKVRPAMTLVEPPAPTGDTAPVWVQPLSGVANPVAGGTVSVSLPERVSANPPATFSLLVGASAALSIVAGNLIIDATALAGGATITGTVRATNTVGTADSAISLTVQASATAPAQVTGLTATPGNNVVNLSWAAPANGGSPITGYRIERRVGAGAWADLISNTTSAATSYQDETAANGTTYGYRVSAINDVAPTGGEPSTEATATPAAAEWTLAYSENFNAALGAEWIDNSGTVVTGGALRVESTGGTGRFITLNPPGVLPASQRVRFTLVEFNPSAGNLAGFGVVKFKASKVGGNADIANTGDGYRVPLNTNLSTNIGKRRNGSTESGMSATSAVPLASGQIIEMEFDADTKTVTLRQNGVVTASFVDDEAATPAMTGELVHIRLFVSAGGNVNAARIDNLEVWVK